METKQFILLGPPGAGVKEQAIALAARWHVPCVSAGLLLRQAVAQQSEIGLQAKAYLEAGELVPDEWMMTLIRRRFEQPDVMLKGWVLHGFPRTLLQAQAFDELLLRFGLPAASVVHLKVMKGLLIDRILARQDNSESAASIRRRLQAHEAECAPVLDYYRAQSEGRSQLTTVNGSLSADEVASTLAQLIYEETGAARMIRDEAELNSLLAREPVLVVDCMASWCGPCKLVTPMVDKLADAYGDRAKVMKIDFDTNQQLPKRFKLKGMPAVMVFKGGELMETVTGVKPYQAYSAAVSRFL